MPRPDPRKLEIRAAEAYRKGRIRKSVELYGQLEELEPHEVRWPQRRAEMLRRAGREREELAALERCAAIHSARGATIKAIAACKRILEIDPTHTATQDRLACLQCEGIAARPARRPAGKKASSDASVNRLSRHEPPPPLEEILLSEVVPDARPAALQGVRHEVGHDVGENGISEIPLEDVVEEAPEQPAPVSDAAARVLDTPLFGGLDEASLRRTIDALELVRLQEGERLFRQGDPAGALYVVAEGAVVPVAEGTPPRKLAVLEQGDFFGEVGLLTNQPRNASVTAIVDSQLLAIDRALVWSLVRENPEVLPILLRFVRQRLVDRLVRTSALFRSLASGDRSEFAQHFRLLEAKGGESFIDQGQVAEALFVLCAGSADAVFEDRDGRKVLGTLGPGDVFGEMSCCTASRVSPP